MKSTFRPLCVVLSILMLTSLSIARPRQEQRYSLASMGVYEAGPEEVIAQLEQDWVTAIIYKDTAVLDNIMAGDFEGISPNGQRYTKPEALNDVASGLYAVQSMDLHNLKVRLFGDVALVTFDQYEKSKFGEEDTSGLYAFTDTWVYRDGSWQAVGSHGTSVFLP